MKTLLILTDLSENAEHAAKTAMVLSERLRANVFLYNSCLTMPITPYYAHGVLPAENDLWWHEESKKSLTGWQNTLNLTISGRQGRSPRPSARNAEKARWAKI